MTIHSGSFSRTKKLALSAFTTFVSNARQQPLVANTLGTLIIRGGTTGTRLIITFMIARTVSPSDFGVLVFILAVIEIVKSVADLGIDTLAVRELAIVQDKSLQNSFLSATALMKFICCFLAYIGLVSTFFILHRTDFEIKSVSVLGLLIFTGLTANLAIDFFQAKLRMTVIVLPVFIINLCSLLLIYILSLLEFGPVTLISILPLAEGISASILIFLLIRKSNWVLAKVSLVSLFNLLQRSAPIAITTILVIAYTRLDILFLSRFTNSAAVGFYGVAYRMTEPFQLIAATFSVSIYSHLSQIFAAEPLALRNKSIRYIRIMLSYGFGVCILLILVAPYLIRSYLPTYSSAVPILRILAIALVARGLNTCLTAIIQATGQYSRITLVALANMIIISGFLWLLLPIYGAVGAALALLLGEVINTAIQLTILGQNSAIASSPHSLRSG